MKYSILVVCVAVTVSAFAQVPVEQVAEDALVVERVAEVSQRDLPGALLRRLVTEDIELLRGKRKDGTYQYATYERLEADRKSESFSIQTRGEQELTRSEIRGSWVYRLVISLPSRRLMVTRNRKLWIDRVELEFVPVDGIETRRETIRVEEWLEPGKLRLIDFPAVAKQATARTFTRPDKEEGYANVVLTLLQARVVDNSDSPYAEAVANAKAALRAIENNDVSSLRAVARKMRESLTGKAAEAEPASRVLEVVAPAESDEQLYRELQTIEDLLTGSDAERRQGLDQLHQLVRRLRPR